MSGSTKNWLVVIVVAIFAGAAGAWWYLTQQQQKPWCVPGRALQLKGTALTVKGLEDYKSEDASAKLCHLTATIGQVQADYYLDQTALADFAVASANGGKGTGKSGSGCIVYGVIGSDRARTETCFGNPK